VGKTRDELKLAVESRIGLINIESEFEFEMLADLLSAWDVRPQISFRINPNVNAKSHPYISTGLKTHKFGLTLDRARALYERAAKNKNMIVKGVSVHIGSQMTDLRPLADALSKTLDFLESLSEAARRNLDTLDAGGGLGINYRDPDAPADFEKYSKILLKAAQRWKKICLAPQPRMACENGRSIVAQSGRLVSRVIGVKQTSKTPFVILDASMSELLRPSLYQARHAITVPGQSKKAKNSKFNVVGPVCESSDSFGEAYSLPKEIKENTLLAIESCGAYGATMSSFYNIRALPAEYWLDSQGNLSVSRERRSFADLYTLAR
jgi:diaminopimelate decarboxylase